MRPEFFAPPRQSVSVVFCEIGLFHQLKIRMLAHGGEHGRPGGEETARENMAIDEVDGTPIGVVSAIGHRDRLQGEQPVWLEQPRALLEERGQHGLAHRFNHLDRHEFVIRSLQVAVVNLFEFHALVQPGCGDAAFRLAKLLLRDRSGRHAAPVLAGGIHGEPAPPGSDLQHVITGRQLQETTHAIVLGP